MNSKVRRGMEITALAVLCIFVVCSAVKADAALTTAAMDIKTEETEIQDQSGNYGQMVTGQNFIWVDDCMIGSLIRDYDDGVYYMGIQEEDGAIRQLGEGMECSNLVYYKDELYFINSGFPDMLQNIRHHDTEQGRIVKMQPDETYTFLTGTDELTNVFYIWKDRIYYQVAEDLGNDEKEKHNIYYYVPEIDFTHVDEKNDIRYHIYSMDLNGGDKKEICSGMNWTADFIMSEEGDIYIAEGDYGIVRCREDSHRGGRKLKPVLDFFSPQLSFDADNDSDGRKLMMDYETLYYLTGMFKNHEWSVTDMVVKGKYLYIAYSNLEEFGYDEREIYCLEIMDDYLKPVEGHTESDWLWRTRNIQALYRTSLMLKNGQVARHYGLFDISTGFGSSKFWIERQEREFWDTGLSGQWKLETYEPGKVLEKTILVDRILQREGDYLYLLCPDGIYRYPIRGGEIENVGITVHEDREWIIHEETVRGTDSAAEGISAEEMGEEGADGLIPEAVAWTEGNGCIYYSEIGQEKEGTATIYREKNGGREEVVTHNTDSVSEYWRGREHQYHSCRIINMFCRNGYLYYTLIKELAPWAENGYVAGFGYIYRIPENGGEPEKLADCGKDCYLYGDKIYYKAGVCYWEMNLDGTGKRVVYERKAGGTESFAVGGGCLYLYENLYGTPEILGIHLETGARKRFPIVLPDSMRDSKYLYDEMKIQYRDGCLYMDIEDEVICMDFFLS